MTRKPWIWLFVFFIQVPFLLHAQTTTPPLVVPNVLLPSPQASALGKYGNFGVGMFTGTAQFDIPLYTLQSSKIEVPISLSYQSNGLKVDENPSSVGMSWVLNAGGVVTRIVYDKPDFNFARAPLPPTGDFAHDTTAQANLAVWLENYSANSFDSQMDEFSFNFSGYSGKFFINRNNQPVLVPYSPLKIEYDFSATNWTFKITAPNGFKYYFGGTGATEGGYSTTCSSHGALPLSSNSWFLKKIENPTDVSDSVNFYYQPMNFNYMAGISQTYTFPDSANILDPHVQAYLQGNPNPDYPVCGFNPYIYQNNYNQFCRSNIYVSGLFLKEIKDSKYTDILIDSILKPDISGGNDFLVKRLTISNWRSGQRIKSFLFNYSMVAPNLSYSNDYTTTAARPFLIEVDETDKDLNTIKPYKFEYQNLNNLPPRLSFAQDYYGYFNGVSQKAFIPLVDEFPRLVISKQYANRNSNYDFAGNGLLSKITYPTGGYTSIIYEGNTQSTKSNFTTDTYETKDLFSKAQTTATTIGSSSTFMVYDTISVSITGTLACGCPTGGCTTYPDNTVWGEFVQNGSITLGQYNFAVFNARGDCSKSYGQVFTIPPGMYAIGTIPKSPFNETLTITVQTPYKSIYLPEPQSSLPATTSLGTAGCGLRVKSFISTDPFSGQTVAKNFVYDGLVIPAYPMYKRYLVNRMAGNPNPACVIPDYTEADYDQYYSSSLVNLFGTGAHPAYYRKVTEYEGTSNLNGGIEHYFTYVAPPPLSPLSGSPIPSVGVPDLSWQSGLDTLDVYFKMKDSLKIPVLKKHTVYSLDPRKSDTLYQYAIERAGTATPVNGHVSAPDIRIKMFNSASIPYITQWQYPALEKTENFDLDGNPTTSNTTYSFYDNPTHGQLTRQQEVNSKGETITAYKLFPADYTDASGPVGDLKTAFMNNSPIEVTTTMTSAAGVTSVIGGNLIKYKADGSRLPAEQLQTEITSAIPLSSFRFSNQSAAGVLPSAQGVNTSFTPDPNYKSFSLFDSYTANANIQQQHKTNDITESYIWNYQGTLPTAKVTNALVSDIAQTSFEADGTGGWNNYTGVITTTTSAPTGNKYYNLTTTATLSKTVTSGSLYTVSYWSKNGSYSIGGGTGTIKTGKTVAGWTYYEHAITATTASLSISGTGAIDEVRLYPASSRMRSFTYEPLIGITSECDINNDVTYYEYDNFGRLFLVRDQDRNIIKRNCYNYLNQVSPCDPPYVKLTFGNSLAVTNFHCSLTNTVTGLTYSFPTITANYYGYLTVPLGVYNITFSNSNGKSYTYGTCLTTKSGTTVTFSNVDVSVCSLLGVADPNAIVAPTPPDEQ